MGGIVKRILAIDTATDAVVAGVATLGAEGAGIDTRAERRVADGRRHAEILTTLIGEVLTESGTARADLDAVVVGCGPGPFTGLRVGMATGAAFGDALGLPVYGVCSLDAVAWQVFSERPTVRSVLVVTDARRREIYWARYVDGRRLGEPQVTAPAQVVDEMSAESIDLVVGSPVHAAMFDRAVGDASTPSVAGLVASAADDLRSGATPRPLVPLYLRRPDAVESAKRKRLGVVR
ncbi:tRNA (adenosine(37)-N6)-threonylcarbamoyltransferase complex dimerization subunit type 1 TsaB [Gordonia sp. CPCC 205515]|uniref:tRNA (adenosine(37)-N6)-threonylcarbamoyltransferase complex dimerization subunit type 1 TsaB n=1 Tax=Gordonia sp. CPCC 205515 TaxID=3140791 RepID=UPI003AF392D6